jgi:hypothetical protein
LPVIRSPPGVGDNGLWIVNRTSTTFNGLSNIAKVEVCLRGSGAITFIDFDDCPPVASPTSVSETQFHCLILFSSCLDQSTTHIHHIFFKQSPSQAPTVSTRTLLPTAGPSAGPTALPTNRPSKWLSLLH